jgi:hypothetical protein
LWVSDEGCDAEQAPRMQAMRAGSRALRKVHDALKPAVPATAAPLTRMPGAALASL